VTAIKIHIQILLDGKQKKEASSRVKKLDHITKDVSFEAKSGYDYGLNSFNYI